MSPNRLSWVSVRLCNGEGVSVGMQEQPLPFDFDFDFESHEQAEDTKGSAQTHMRCSVLSAPGEGGGKPIAHLPAEQPPELMQRQPKLPQLRCVAATAAHTITTSSSGVGAVTAISRSRRPRLCVQVTEEALGLRGPVNGLTGEHVTVQRERHAQWERQEGNRAGRGREATGHKGQKKQEGSRAEGAGGR